jgi:hypothetical protein
MDNNQILQTLINQTIGSFELLLLDYDFKDYISQYKNLIVKLRQDRLARPTDKNIDLQINRLTRLIDILEYAQKLNVKPNISLN